MILLDKFIRSHFLKEPRHHWVPICNLLSDLLTSSRIIERTREVFIMLKYFRFFLFLYGNFHITLIKFYSIYTFILFLVPFSFICNVSLVILRLFSTSILGAYVTQVENMYEKVILDFLTLLSKSSLSSLR